MAKRESGNYIMGKRTRAVIKDPLLCLLLGNACTVPRHVFNIAVPGGG